jgi:hypothetical protein
MGVAAPKQQCRGIRKGGGACKSFTLPGADYCFLHSPEHAEAVRAARARGGRAAATVRALRRRREPLDTAAALVRCASEIVQDTLEETLEPERARAALYGLSLLRQFIEARDFEARFLAIEQQLGLSYAPPGRG